jgi:quinoprotein glucose dehydrogenase
VTLPPLARIPATAPEAWGLTPFDRAACRRQLEGLRYEGIFTPPSLQGTLLLPGYSGGANWGGVAIDEARQLVVGNVTNLPFMVRLIPRAHFEHERAANDQGAREFAPQHGTPYGLVRGPVLSPLGLPCIAPPWGTLNAVSLERGALLWSVPLGTVPDRVPVPLPLTLGLPSLGGPLITAGGLVFIAAAMDGYIRAFDLATGAELWQERLPAGGNATPMSYAVNGDQYVAIAAGGHGKLGTRAGDSVIAWRLPASLNAAAD